MAPIFFSKATFQRVKSSSGKINEYSWKETVKTAGEN